MSDSDFERAWRLFKEEDAHDEAPLRVRIAVMEAWEDGQRHRAPSPVHKSDLTPAVRILAAAALIVVVAATLIENRRGPNRAAPALASRVTETMPADAARRRVDVEPIFTLMSDQTFDSESLRIMRVRVPRASLEALGIALLEPDTGGLVDIDVVVGDDGLPLEIRRILRVL
jgi:hypothetical protein